MQIESVRNLTQNILGIKKIWITRDIITQSCLNKSNISITELDHLFKSESFILFHCLSKPPVLSLIKSFKILVQFIPKQCYLFYLSEFRRGK